jgi:hypothetical protein
VTGPAFEAFLARLYADTAARERFLADPRGEARRAGLGPAEAAALDRIDLDDLALAAVSYARKAARVPVPGKERGGV